MLPEIPVVTATVAPDVKPTTIDEREIPTIEVSGANLTASCVDLDAKGRSPNSRVVNCRIGSDAEDEAEMKVDAFKLKSATEDSELGPVAVSGVRGAEPGSWKIAKNNEIGIQFDVPDASMDSYRKYPARVEMQNLSMNGAPVPGNPAFQTRVHNYVVKDELCATTQATVQEVSLKFSEKGGDTFGRVYWSEAHWNGQQPISPDSIFCNTEFIDDLAFTWPAQTNRPERRIAATVGGWNVVMTNV
ncbi:hypothetical protein EBR21_17455, partial [bacterium]|nr:hypothetical protein [bacterium]